MSRHADYLKLSPDRAREREAWWNAHGPLSGTNGGPPVDLDESLRRVTKALHRPRSNPLHDHLIREFVRSVAKATAEYLAEQAYDGPA